MLYIVSQLEEALHQSGCIDGYIDIMSISVISRSVVSLMRDSLLPVTTQVSTNGSLSKTSWKLFRYHTQDVLQQPVFDNSLACHVIQAACTSQHYVVWTLQPIHVSYKTNYN